MLEYLNSDAGKLMTILVSIIVIVLLFLIFGRKQEHTKLHTYYISGFSVFIIIELVTYICVNNYDAKNIVGYISFASTISSLFLSVVAIIYAIVSNNKGETQYKKIDTASDRMAISVDRFSQISENLTGNIDSILKKLDVLQDISTETKKVVTSSFQMSSENLGPDILNGGKRISTSDLVSRYIQGGSYWGNLALLACVYSYNKKKSFPLSEIFGEDEVGNSYAYGYIISSSALGIVSAQISEKNIVSVDKIVDLDIQKKLESKIEEMIEDIPDDNVFKKEISAEYQSVKNYFKIKDTDKTKEA